MSTSNYAGYGPRQQVAFAEAQRAIDLHLRGRCSRDGALMVAAIRARRAEIPLEDFVALVRANLPQVSTPRALLAWLHAPAAAE